MVNVCCYNECLLLKMLCCVGSVLKVDFVCFVNMMGMVVGSIIGVFVDVKLIEFVGCIEG